MEDSAGYVDWGKFGTSFGWYRYVRYVKDDFAKIEYHEKTGDYVVTLLGYDGTSTFRSFEQAMDAAIRRYESPMVPLSETGAMDTAGLSPVPLIQQDSSSTVQHAIHDRYPFLWEDDPRWSPIPASSYLPGGPGPMRTRSVLQVPDPWNKQGREAYNPR